MTNPPAPLYIGPPRNHGPRTNKPIHHVVIHSTVSKCERGGARKIARYFMQTQRDASAHYITDPGEVVQGLYDSWVGYAAPPNQHKLHVEMCDIPGPVPDDSVSAARRKALRRAWRWVRPEQRAMLENTAQLVGQLCAAYDIPPWFRGVRDLKAGRRGVTTHACVSKAFRQSTHWDPGWWPRLRFMRRVRHHYNIARKADK